MAELAEIPCDDLDEGIDQQKALGYRLDMIFPAESPREALMSKGGESVRLLSEQHESAGEIATTEFVRGRAGMEYRDLIPGRLGGKVIASHIRLPFGGEVPDSVHYHKIDFQMIYCVRGRIQVVYEDQGQPFWLETSDFVLQPPGIRHRVLYSEPGAEVIEVSSPSDHETWIDHEMSLPTDEIRPDRLFGSQRFLYKSTERTSWFEMPVGNLLMNESDLTSYSRQLVGIRRYKPKKNEYLRCTNGGMAGVTLLVVIIKGELRLRTDELVLAKDDSEDQTYSVGDSYVLSPYTLFDLDCSYDIEYVEIGLNL